MHIRLLLPICVLLLGMSCSSSRNTSPDSASSKEWVIGFYNVENLFDTLDHPVKIDEEFLPGSELDWTTAKYQQKLSNLSRAIQGMGENGPDVLGLAEVENRAVIEDLTRAMPGRNYGIVHEESPDMRGIDVALIYDTKRMKYIRHQAVEVDFPAEADYTSRLILLVEGEMAGETLYLLVNHWPSRYGGAEKSEGRRVRVAEVVRGLLDSLRQKNPDADLLLMGDFNDDPFDRSLTEVLLAKESSDALSAADLYSPLWGMHQVDSVGTLTYRGKWNLFDQLLLSPALLDDTGKLRYVTGSATIHGPEFMQVGGDGNAKDMPRRAIYRGEFQDRGFSDHFPVYLRLRKQ